MLNYTAITIFLREMGDIGQILYNINNDHIHTFVGIQCQVSEDKY